MEEEKPDEMEVAEKKDEEREEKEKCQEVKFFLIFQANFLDCS